MPSWTPPEEFDGFRVVGRLGSGGMGHVLRVLDVMLEREVAVKVLREADVSEATRERFVREARALARLQHPNVVAVFRIGAIGERPYLAYELVDGTTLEAHTRDAQGWPEATELLQQLVAGLAAAHRAGILHRDVKPANAVVRVDGVVKLIDFGLAQAFGERAIREAPAAASAEAGPTRPIRLSERPFVSDEDTLEIPVARPPSGVEARLDSPLTEPGAVLGTPRYLAPERWLGEPASAASDVWAIGVIARELLLGTPTFVGSNVARVIVDTTLPPLLEVRPDLPPELGAIVDRCTAREPRERYASAEELREALDAFVARQRSTGALSDPGLRAAAVDEDDATRIRDACGPLVARHDFVAGFYARLFAANPSLRPLFPSDMRAQARKLSEALEAVVSALRDPLALRDTVEALGARHVAYGVVPEHLAPLTTAIRENLRDFGAFADPAVERAWDRAFAELEDAFLAGMRRARAARRAPSASRPRTRYVQVGTSSIAFQVVGEGPRTFVVAPGWVSHVEAARALPGYEAWLDALSKLGRVVVFDKRGSGLSCRSEVTLPLEERAADLLRVMDAVGADRATLIGMQDGGAAALYAAAVAPERVEALVLHAFGRRLVASMDYPEGLSEARLRAGRDVLFANWGAPLFLEDIAPGRVRDARLRDAWSELLRAAASPNSACALLEESWRMDVEPLLSLTRVPTLLLHRRGDRVMSIDGGRDVHRRLSDATWVELEGDDHWPWLGEVGPWMEALERFLAAREPSSTTSRLLATVDVEGPGATEARVALLKAGLREHEGRPVALGPAAAIAAGMAAKRPDTRALVDVAADEDDANLRSGVLAKVPLGAVGVTSRALKLAAGGDFEVEATDDELALIKR
ncbi:MAG: alpha/beta fold hydrolase [Sandaracinus sp.]|nr:alpha/beta fold hydrolase [Sandaracinus sp.]